MKKVRLLAPALGMIILCFSTAAVFAGDQAKPMPLSLDEAVGMAVRNNLDYRSSALDVRNAEISLAQTKSNSLLKPSPSSALQAESSLSTAKRNYDIAKIDLQVNVANAYFSLIKAQSSVTVYQNALKSSQDNLAIVVDKLNAGVATNLDRIKAQSDVNSKQANLDKAQKNLVLAEIQLEQILGLSSDAAMALTTTPTFEIVTADLDKDMAQALDRRLEIRQAQDTLKVREMDVKLNTNSYTAALTLQTSQVSLEKAGIALEQAKNKVVQDVMNSYISLTSAYNSIISLQQSVESNKENLRVVQLQYEADMLVNSNVIDAQNTLLQSQIDLQNAMMDYQVAKIKYTKSICADSAGK